jgi:hypothetical protein
VLKQTHRFRPLEEVADVLICRPVSKRSEPQKIRNWIRELEEQRSRHSEDPEVCSLIDRCIAQASSWLAPGYEAAMS